MNNKYTLFDGLAYNTCRYFASCVVFFQAPQGRGKIWVMSKMSARIISNNRFIIPLLKKICYFAVGFYCFGKSIQKHPDSVSENDVKSEQMFAHIICQTIEWEVNYSTAKQKQCYFGFYFLVGVSKTSYSSVIVVLFPSADIRPLKAGQTRTLKYIAASYFARSLDLIW